MTIKERYSDEVNVYDYFNPYRIKDNVEPFMGGYPIIFMTTPGMNIYESDNKVFQDLIMFDPVFGFLNDTDPYILQQLQYHGVGGGTTSPFIKLVTNRFKGTTLRDFIMRNEENYENYYGWKQILPAGDSENFSAQESFIINFSETKNLDILKIFYAWMRYIEAVRMGYHEPSQLTRDNRILDFTSSIYLFLLDFDMQTILYFAKYTGVYPNTVPFGNIIMSDIASTKAPLDPAVVFSYQHKEEFNPQIIYDFNMISNRTDKIFTFNKGNLLKTNHAITMNDYNNLGYALYQNYDPFHITTGSEYEDIDAGSGATFIGGYEGVHDAYEKSKKEKGINTTASNSFVGASSETFKAQAEADTLNKSLVYDQKSSQAGVKNTSSTLKTIGNDFDGRDYLFQKNYNHACIKWMKEGNYDSHNNTAFNSAENDSKKTLILCFDNNTNKSDAQDYNKFLNNNSVNLLSKDEIARLTKGLAGDRYLYGDDSDLTKAELNKRQKNLYDVYVKKKLTEAMKNYKDYDKSYFTDLKDFQSKLDEVLKEYYSTDSEQEEDSEEGKMNKDHNNTQNYAHPYYWYNDKFDFNKFINYYSQEGVEGSQDEINVATFWRDMVLNVTKNTEIKSYSDWINSSDAESYKTAAKEGKDNATKLVAANLNGYTYDQMTEEVLNSESTQETVNNLQARYYVDQLLGNQNKDTALNTANYQANKYLSGWL